MALANGQVLQQRYRIVALLGQGGMGAVYRAWDTRLKVHVALKEMTPQPGLDPQALAHLRQQFEQEAVILAHLSHPHLVDVSDFFEEMGNAYLVMKFVEGESMAARIEQEGAQPEAQVLEWASQLLGALAYCHSEGVLHRDIKPQNVILRPDGRAMLVDFGLVKLWDPGDPRTKTAMRGMGTPEYAPPEQYDTASGHTDPRSDLYSLGATLYHALTGRTPPTATQRIVDPQALAPIEVIAPGVGAQTAAAVSRAIELRPADRFQSAQEMAAALRGTAPASSRPTPPPPTKVLPGSQTATPLPPARRPAWLPILAVLALLAVVVGGISLVAWGLGRSAQTMPTPIPTQPMLSPVPTAVPAPTETPLPMPLPTLRPDSANLYDDWTRPADGMTLVYVPAGEFLMGLGEAEMSFGSWDSFPPHSVGVDGFWLDRTEVTVAQFRFFVSATGYETTAEQRGWSYVHTGSWWDEIPGADWEQPLGPGILAEDTHPVTHVSWDDAAAYCAWVGGRLPTEAEWEYAARGPNNFKYPWGNIAPSCRRANYWSQEGGCVGWTAPVGSYAGDPSWVSALDMAGNAMEWVADWFGPYAAESQVNPTGPEVGEERVQRGGG